MKRFALVALALGAVVSAGCESSSGTAAAPTPDAQSDLAVGGSDADAADSSAVDAQADTGAVDALADAASATDVSVDVQDSVGDSDAVAVDAADVSIDAASDVEKDIANPPVPAGGCSAEVTCEKMPGAYCLKPGAFGGCGICMKPDGPGCQADSECSELPNGICELRTDNCLCDKIPLCYEGCSKDAECAEGQVCAADHHCKVKSCSGDGDCPAHFACQSGQCQRKTCSASASCPGGYCVGGECFAKAGTCDLPKP